MKSAYCSALLSISIVSPLSLKLLPSGTFHLPAQCLPPPFFFLRNKQDLVTDKPCLSRSSQLYKMVTRSSSRHYWSILVEHAQQQDSARQGSYQHNWEPRRIRRLPSTLTVPGMQLRSMVSTGKIVICSFWRSHETTQVPPHCFSAVTYRCTVQQLWGSRCIPKPCSRVVLSSIFGNRRPRGNMVDKASMLELISSTNHDSPPGVESPHEHTSLGRTLIGLPCGSPPGRPHHQSSFMLSDLSPRQMLTGPQRIGYVEPLLQWLRVLLLGGMVPS